MRCNAQNPQPATGGVYYLDVAVSNSDLPSEGAEEEEFSIEMLGDEIAVETLGLNGGTDGLQFR